MDGTQTVGRQDGVCSATDFEQGFELDYGIVLSASPERVFRALTDEVHRWWPHTMRENPHRIVLEPQIGGRFMELYDEQGSGALYGLVEIYEPPTTLRIRGSVGMGLAVNLLWTVTLTPAGEGCRVRELCRVSGDTSQRMREGMRRGTEAEYEILKRWVETGEALR